MCQLMKINTFPSTTFEMLKKSLFHTNYEINHTVVWDGECVQLAIDTLHKQDSTMTTSDLLIIIGFSYLFVSVHCSLRLMFGGRLPMACCYHSCIQSQMT